MQHNSVVAGLFPLMVSFAEQTSSFALSRGCSNSVFPIAVGKFVIFTVCLSFSREWLFNLGCTGEVVMGSMFLFVRVCPGNGLRKLFGARGARCAMWARSGAGEEAGLRVAPGGGQPRILPSINS